MVYHDRMLKHIVSMSLLLLLAVTVFSALNFYQLCNSP